MLAWQYFAISSISPAPPWVLGHPHPHHSPTLHCIHLHVRLLSLLPETHRISFHEGTLQAWPGDYSLLLLREETDSREMSSLPKLTILEAEQELKPTLLTSCFLPSNQVSHSPSTFPARFSHFPSLCGC